MLFSVLDMQNEEQGDFGQRSCPFEQSLVAMTRTMSLHHCINVMENRKFHIFPTICYNCRRDMVKETLRVVVMVMMTKQMAEIRSSTLHPTHDALAVCINIFR